MYKYILGGKNTIFLNNGIKIQINRKNVIEINQL